ncbi:TorF family putative porin [Methylophaga thiooxydans]|uniref:Uncharacterized protein n=1 Tax=Methylophaga thiooxydans DMS010 TaxID=637616 RepID=C0N5H5_9GAMM|nr:TorF family putative porin [Methylophaga thiooxydans]EEF80004.1 conserved hypothetical protein [Methylophaga thiooxydans DMS010]|mmetsp:Transcript_26516/g.45255  ORF Transcript_26516/g.45255 Transcript_26516/m.45255 type:complete len:237 (-) Transcript_26516:1686-2396(-)
MKLSKLSALCFAATTMFAASSAMAWESEDGAHSTSASVAFSSEYIWRGVSQTDGDPAISGSLDYSHSSGFYAGAWGSNVDYGDDASAEFDVYLGYGGEFGDTGIGYDVGFLRYMFPGEDYNFNEVYGSLSYSIFSAGIAYSNDTLGSDEDGYYYYVDASYDLPMGLNLYGGYGVYDADEATFTDGVDDYGHYWIGVSKDVAGFTLDLSYQDADSDAEDWAGDLAEETFLFSVSRSF